MTLLQFIERLTALISLWISKIEGAGDGISDVRTTLKKLLESTEKLRPVLAPFEQAPVDTIHKVEVLAFLVNCHAKLKRLGPRIEALCDGKGTSDYEVLMQAAEIADGRLQLEMYSAKLPHSSDPDDRDSAWRIRHSDDLRQLRLALDQLRVAKLKVQNDRDTLLEKAHAAIADAASREFCTTFDNLSGVFDMILEDIRLGEAPERRFYLVLRCFPSMCLNSPSSRRVLLYSQHASGTSLKTRTRQPSGKAALRTSTTGCSRAKRVNTSEAASVL